MRVELAKKTELTHFTLSGYGSVRGNGLIQIYKSEWMPCLFYNEPLEIHFEIQDNRIFRLDCHWYPYYKFKNLNYKQLINKFPRLENLIETRKQFISELSREAKQACLNNGRLRQVRFNAVSGIEWVWDNNCDWRDIATEIAEIITAVSPCVENHFGNELNLYSELSN